MAKFEAEAAAQADRELFLLCRENKLRRTLVNVLRVGDVIDNFAVPENVNKFAVPDVAAKFKGEYFDFGGAGLETEDDPEQTSCKKAGARRKVTSKKIPARPVPKKADPEEVQRLAKAAGKDGFAFGLRNSKPAWNLTLPSTSCGEKSEVTETEVESSIKAFAIPMSPTSRNASPATSSKPFRTSADNSDSEDSLPTTSTPRTTPERDTEASCEAVKIEEKDKKPRVTEDENGVQDEDDNHMTRATTTRRERRRTRVTSRIRTTSSSLSRFFYWTCSELGGILL
jgi:hypothetical protein